jgi:hypothetical protein
MKGAVMTTEQRVARLERAFATLALRVTSNYPLRGPDSDPGIVACKAIVAEVQAIDEANAQEARRDAMQRELDEMEVA